MKHRLMLDMAFTATGNDTDAAFDRFTDRIMDALLELEEINEGIHDPHAAATLTQRTICVSLVVTAETRADATLIFLNTLRTALHAAGGHTPDWPRWAPARPLSADAVELGAA